MRRSLYLIPIVMLLVACADDPHVIDCLGHAEAYLPTQPDSAEMWLSDIPHPERLSKPNKALYGLLRTIADNRQGEGVDSDSLIGESHAYYQHAIQREKTPGKTLLRRYAQSCYYMALYYSSCDSTKQCEDLLRQSIKYSTKCEDWHTCYLAHTLLCTTNAWSNPEYATEQALKALNIYHKINDDVNNEVLILGHIASCYLTTTDSKNALKHFFKGYELAKKNNLLKSQKEMCAGIAGTYLYMEEHDKALQYAKASVAIADSAFLVPSQLTLAQCYYANDSIAQAFSILNTVKDNAQPLDKYLIYRQLAEIAIETQALDSLSAYTDSAFESMENRYLQAQQVKDEYYQENIAKELQKERISHEAERQKMFFYVITSLFILAGIILYHFWARAKARRMAQARLLAQQLTTMSSLYRKTKEELEIMDNDLSAYKVQKQEELDELHRQLKQLQKEHGEFNQKERFEALKQSPIIETLNERLKPTAKSNILTEKEWDALIDTFWQYMPSLTLFLGDKQTLTPLELRIAILTRLNFRSDDIALLLNISRQHVSNLKGSANKKLFSDGSARTFFQNLCKI